MKQFCPHCGNVRDVRLKTEEETYPFRGQIIAVSSRSFRCSVCDRRFSTAEQADHTLQAVREEYRRLHNLVTPEEIVSIRKQYDAGQKPFGRILGLGKATINSYENGEVPTTANSNLIRQAADSGVFARMYGERRNQIGPTQQKRIDAALAQRPSYVISFSGSISVHEEPDEYTGFRPQDRRRLDALFRAILARLGGPVYKTKLLKLAFLADHEHFRANTVSITGWPYARLDHGPVPQDYKELLVAAEQDGIIVSQDHDDGTTTFLAGDGTAAGGEQSMFSEDEIESIDRVCRRWGPLGATELSRYTHTLAAWQNTSHAEEISYVHAVEEYAQGDDSQGGIPPKS